MSLKDEQGLGIIDTLIVLVIISVFLGVLMPRYERTAREAQGVALQITLGSIRKAVQVYVLTQKKIPDDIRDLTREKYIFSTREGTIFTTEYLRAVSMDEDGYPIDPFGNRYGYDPSNGRVYSTTEGYGKL